MLYAYVEQCRSSEKSPLSVIYAITGVVDDGQQVSSYMTVHIHVYTYMHVHVYTCTIKFVCIIHNLS